MAKQRQRRVRPLCKSHWQKMRSEALSVLPLWSRPLAVIKINRMLRDKGFVRSDAECSLCESKAAP